MTQVSITDSARTDLLEAWVYIAEVSVAAADRCTDAIMLAARTLAEHPNIGRERNELGDGVRSWPTSTPYLIYYQIDHDGITLLRVLHHARDAQSTMTGSGSTSV